MNKAFDIFNPTEEHQQLRENVRRFAEAEMDGQAASYDEKESFNEALFRKFATQLGLFGLTVSEKDGGAGMDVTASVLVHEELSRFDPALTLSFLAHEVLFVNNFYHCSNEQQRERYLGKVIDGTWIAGMAMTEPEAGTDVLAMRTRALRKGDRFVLNGTKQFITNGPYGNVFLVYAKTGDGPKDVSAFVVESSFAGFSVGKKESKMGMRASPTSCLVFEDMEVPASNLLGSEGGALVHMMRNLEIERLTLAAQSVGIALRCCDVMTQYAVAERKAFGQPLAEFGQIQRLLSESYAHTQAARALVYATALRISPEHRESLGAAASK
ncbi:MAG TPA: acyl-CoA dehydrogenase family protein, partial [Polyangiaceae bacterium]|nr:acyl-CoA dehydrogenase family protein [Polyangiaceae bacterium]